MYLIHNIGKSSISNEFTIYGHLTIVTYDLRWFSVTILVNVVKLTEVLIIQKKIYDEYLVNNHFNTNHTFEE